MSHYSETAKGTLNLDRPTGSPTVFSSLGFPEALTAGEKAGMRGEKGQLQSPGDPDIQPPPPRTDGGMDVNDDGDRKKRG